MKATVTASYSRSLRMNLKIMKRWPSHVTTTHPGNTRDSGQQGKQRLNNKLMARRRRKTLVICRRCHEDIHAGRATTPYPK